MNEHSEDKKIFAKILINIGCLQVSPNTPFTYASGLKGPIYCDNRKILSYIKEREEIVEAFSKIIETHDLKFDLIAGLATAGIPHGMLLAHNIKKPFIYIRGSAKGHGKNNQVEGDYKDGDKILMVEDLVNQGKSLKEAVLGSRAAGLLVSNVLSIVDYQMGNALTTLEDLDLNLYSLTDFSSICEAALEIKSITENEYDMLKNWQKDPVAWSAR